MHFRNPPGFIGRSRWASTLFAALLLSLSGNAFLQAQIAGSGDADAAWQQIVASESGPKATAQSSDQSKAATLQHLDLQEHVLRHFISSFPSDPRCFGANLRLAHLFTVRSEIKANDKDWAEALKILDSLATTCPPEKRVDVDFARISLMMLRYKPGENTAIEPLLARARDFQRDYPQDRRVARMLVEIATLFDDQPAKKESLLQQARMVASDAGTQKRIEDDLKRIALLDKPLDLKFTSIQGKPIDLKQSNGKAVFVVFFAEWSAPSLKALEGVQAAVKKFPKSEAIGISLDSSPEQLAAFVKSRGLVWPVYCDYQGWKSPLARGFGINSLPTVWLVDRNGILRRLNVRANWEEALRKILE